MKDKNFNPPNLPCAVEDKPPVGRGLAWSWSAMAGSLSLFVGNIATNTNENTAWVMWWLSGLMVVGGAVPHLQRHLHSQDKKAHTLRMTEDAFFVDEYKGSEIAPSKTYEFDTNSLEIKDYEKFNDPRMHIIFTRVSNAGVQIYDAKGTYVTIDYLMKKEAADLIKTVKMAKSYSAAPYHMRHLWHSDRVTPSQN